ncbi:MAG: cation:proton antiporter [Planctomycetes bacterium]|nr:cation:proton antiporter [Planctomycetota bacterium]MCB9888227.1 cation:proton antiporter [Planctomycetota bacterium]
MYVTNFGYTPLGQAHSGLAEMLLELALLFALCIAVVLCFHRIKLPPIVGFLITGAVVGPHSFGLIEQPELVENLAEIGVVVLLFTVGMELSVRELLRMRRSLVLGGGLQVLVTIALGATVASLGGMPPRTAILVGFVITLSSTAVIAKLLQDRGELGTSPGRLAMSICVAQDLAVVGIILAVPLLGSGGGSGAAEMPLWRVGSSLLYLGALFAGAWLIVPRVLDLVSRARSREVFVLTIFTLCLAGATLTAAMGLSLALGAFLVGLVLAESGYHHQATAEVEPFRDALSSLFFVSIGMLFDYHVILEHPWKVGMGLLAVIVGKALVVWVAARALSLPGWVGVRAGLLLAQVGEFSFVVIQVARSNQLELGAIEGVFLVVAVLSIALTPLLMVLGRRLTERAVPSVGGERSGPTRRKDHVVIVGFGPGGQAVAGALMAQSIPFVVIEMNAATVKAFKARGYPIFLGDSGREAVLKAAALEQARLLVLTVNDPGATRRTADLARRIAPDLHIVARTNYIGDVPVLRRLGVQEIVPQELETSIEIMVRVLRRYLVPDAEVGREVHRVRRGADMPGSAVRPHDRDDARLSEFIPGLSVEAFRVERDSAIAGFALQDSDLRRLSGCTVVAVRRQTDTDIAIRPDTVLTEGDVAVLLGPSHRIAEAGYLFATPRHVAEGEGPSHG